MLAILDRDIRHAERGKDSFLQDLGLQLEVRPEIVVRPHEQPGVRHDVVGKPVLGLSPNFLWAPGDQNDRVGVVVERSNQLNDLRDRRVGTDVRVKRVPIGGALIDVMPPVTDIGDGPVDIYNCNSAHEKLLP